MRKYPLILMCLALLCAAQAVLLSGCKSEATVDNSPAAQQQRLDPGASLGPPQAVDQNAPKPDKDGPVTTDPGSQGPGREKLDPG